MDEPGNHRWCRHRFVLRRKGRSVPSVRWVVAPRLPRRSSGCWRYDQRVERRKTKASNTPVIIKVSHPKKIAATSNRYSRPKPKYHDIPTKAATIKADEAKYTHRVTRSRRELPITRARKAKDSPIARKPSSSRAMNTP